jgi:hypothetical protein
MTKWLGVVLVPVVVGGLVWWGLRGPSQEPAAAALPSGHQVCEPLAGATPDASPLDSLDTGRWSITLGGTHIARSLPGNDGDGFDADDGESFVVIDLDFRRVDETGKAEAKVSSGALSVTCQDGNPLTPWGWLLEGGYCPFCRFDLGIRDRTTRMTFALQLKSAWIHQPFEVRYAGVGPILVRVP